MTTGYYCAIFVAEEKKKHDKKAKAFYDWATTGIPVTRITPTSSTLIALIYSNCVDKIACSGVRHTAITGHSVVFPQRKLAMNGMSNGNNTITNRNLSFGNLTNKAFEMKSHPNLRRTFMHSPIQMRCGWNGNIHFWQQLTNTLH